mmetsp:Transcript_10077/g.19726  ORF Transcript_10077/g.19726 Transcript_10077/m.19726 type:complete len:170 (-) Transcript_10077:340-849(-)|eukprot:CAMPEP_0173388080 /NCGR_PEP_ID=MMETSP1356-20130122/10466_1 /TAXON_ID=77927 ORGANISM="Hemiselmis virescens, Strain PCC157" /NCGR_SAMPLE_ID=MMETSP1356 /ASSEMBLY_ACC=CAM_ASM_000847 /LENGTH=169 /DNA_ID=CAMNT_0014344895 /DNA_START=132 /DNA_END=641 /DNA_ORIENTATION=+
MPNTTAAGASSAYDFEVKDAKGDTINLKEKAAGKVSLFVNTASLCGFTPQYKGLQKLQEQYGDKGLMVHAFPSNEFGSQDPGKIEEIENKVCERFKISFTLYDKVKVKGWEDQTEPLFVYLKENSKVLMSKEIWWNFEKFLVSKEGKVLKRYSSATSPSSIAKDIEANL